MLPLIALSRYCKGRFQDRNDGDGVTDSHPFWVVTDEPDLERAAREIVDENRS